MPFRCCHAALVHSGRREADTVTRTPKPQAQKTQWSPDVRAYVQRAFEQDNAIAGIDTKMMQDKLKEIITHAAETAQLGLINWATYPLPQELIQQERKNSIASLMNPTYAQMASISLTPKPTPNAFDSASKKRKSGDLEMLDPTVKRTRHRPGRSKSPATVWKTG